MLLAVEAVVVVVVPCRDGFVVGIVVVCWKWCRLFVDFLVRLLRLARSVVQS